ncbi:NAD-dependent epimerase/dehydratase family protein [Paenibacillus spongiae]|uniref:NAD-dependent epimerase/dehydratase family protein n=1 Tax=Paenibacillus spongiae TaxID=2909671 RepID=A0ABY5SC38_9BACL|nr:NAD-dependent epimerase/dehydratase family protein [Paenibacillus spongiae]UVI30243.1 NAD-dependent epimerase/dehydratase family protein [Paenibacillus spongiae]
MKKILVTGATGFVGANLLKALIKSGEYEVYITTRRSSDLWRIADVVPQIHKIYECHIDIRSEVFQLMEELKPDIIYHTAAYGGFASQTDAERIIQSNLHATINLLDAAMLYGIQQFINTGSSSEYGIKNDAMKETDLCEPINLYGITKLAATQYCSMMGKSSKYNVCTLRLFSPYGELEDPSRLYPSIVSALERNERPRLSRPHSVRDFIGIDKVLDVYMKIIHISYEPGDVINVGSGRQQTIEQFYRSIASRLRKDIEPIWGEAPPRPHEPIRWEADIHKLNTLMNDEEATYE